MRIKVGYVLCAINLLTLLLILIIVFWANNVLRIILSLPLVLFFPGYTMISALFPRKSSLSNIERVAFSFGLSMAVVPFIELALNYSPWGIFLYPSLISLCIFIIITSSIGWYRGRKLPMEENIALRFDFKPPGMSFRWSGQTLGNKIVTVVLAMLILGALGSLGYVISLPKVEQNFTEFYLLGPDGKAENYPKDIAVGESAKMILGITNHEGVATAYKIIITINGVNAGEIGPVNLNEGQKWEQEIALTPTRQGANQEIMFMLYKGDTSDVYENLILWVDVTG